MSIREVTYYQAQCDLCGSVDDGGDFSAWSGPDAARINAECGDWRVFDVVVPSPAWPHDWVRGRLDGERAYGRSILVCDRHDGDGVDWCATCEDDLDGDGWALGGHWNIAQVCPNRHLNTIDVTA